MGDEKGKKVLRLRGGVQGHLHVRRGSGQVHPVPSQAEGRVREVAKGFLGGLEDLRPERVADRGGVPVDELLERGEPPSVLVGLVPRPFGLPVIHLRTHDPRELPGVGHREIAIAELAQSSVEGTDGPEGLEDDGAVGGTLARGMA